MENFNFLNQHMELMDVKGDYSDILSYFSNLFAQNRVRRVSIDRFSLEYCSASILTDTSSMKIITTEDYPDRDAPDRVVSLRLNVSGLSYKTVIVDMRDDCIGFSEDIEKTLKDYFLEVLDRSTFRFF